jgi:hypothetical protein
MAMLSRYIGTTYAHMLWMELLPVTIITQLINFPIHLFDAP